MARIVCIDDFTQTHKRRIYDVPEGTQVAPYLNNPATTQVIYNGKVVQADQTLRIIHADDIVVLRALPAGGGGGAGAGAQILGFFMKLALSFAIQWAMNELFPPPEEPKSKKPDPVYGWEGIENTTENGAPIPLVYGHHRVGGQFLSTFTRAPNSDEHKLYALLAISGGNVCQINGHTINEDESDVNNNPGLKINEGDVTAFSGVTVGYRIGDWTQPLLPGFDDVITAKSISQELSDSSYYIHTTDDGIEAIELVLVFPNGLVRIDGDNNPHWWSVDIDTKYRDDDSSATWYPNTYTYKAKSRSTYYVTQRIELPKKGKYQIGIRHGGFSGEQHPRAREDCTLHSINEIVYNDVPYKGVAYVGLKAIGSEQLNGRLPKITNETYGREIIVYHPEDSFAPDTAQKIDSDGKHLWGWNAINTTNTEVFVDSFNHYTFTQVCNGDIGDCHGTLQGPYYYKNSLTGDFDVRVKTHHQNYESATDYYLSGGLLVQSQDDSSDYIYIFRYNDRGSGADNYNYRTEDAPNWTTHGDQGAYLRMVRSGSTFTLYGSSDGSTWTEVQSYTNSEISSTVDLGFGLSSFSGDDSPNGAGMNFSEFTFEDSTAYNVEVSSNPAWVIYDLLTNDDWGVGKLIEDSNVDLDTFISFADYCNETIDRGDGIYHKRFRYDGIISEPDKSWDRIQRIAGLYRAVVLKQGNNYHIAFHHPKDPVQLFSMSNIIKDSFNIVYSSQAQGANYWEVEFLNKHNDWKKRFISYIDPDIGDTEPYRREQIDGSGITRPEEAARKALWHCRTNRYLQKKISFRAAADAVTCEPSDRIEVQHKIPKWGTASGRVKSGTATSVDLGELVTLGTGKSYQIRIRHNSDDSIETKNVNNSAGKHTTIYTGTWSTTPAEDDVWVLGEENIVTKPFTVTKIERKDNLECEIRAVEYNESIFDESINQVEDVAYSLLPEPNIIPDSIEDLQLTERAQLLDDGTIRNVIDVSFSLQAQEQIPDSGRRIDKRTPNTAGARVYLQETSQPKWEYIGYTTSGNFTIENELTTGTQYKVAVCATSSWGQHESPGNAPSSTITLSGSTDRPNAPTNLRITRAGSHITLKWDGATGANIAGYEIRYGGGTWATGMLIGSTEGTEYTTTSGAFGRPINWMVKTYTRSGIYCSDALTITRTLEGRLNKNIVITQNEKTSQTADWPGTKTNMVLDNRNLQIDQSTTDQLYGEYVTNIIDAGASIRAFVECYLNTIQIDNTLTWGGVDKTWGSAWADSTTWGEAEEGHISTTLKFRCGNGTSDTDLGNWEEFVPGEYSAQYFQFKVECTTDSTNYNCELTDMEVTIDAPDITAGGNDIYVAGTGTTVITFSDYSGDFNVEPQFVAIPNANHTAYAHSDTIEVVNVTKDVAEVRYRDSAGSQKEGYINFISRGY